MCGITGIFDVRERRHIERAVLTRMNESQHHRGPDEGGLHLEPGIGLGHRRLSIIDLSSGQQPLYNEDGNVCTVFNGEIYNFQELVPELLALGHTFRTRSDTEVIVHAWESWGVDCVHRLRGMFAFAIWDRNRDQLFLARDRLGVKPLYYTDDRSGYFLFGSELKSVLAHPSAARDIQPLAVEDYFAYGYVPEPRTIFEGIYKLPPGHHLTIRRGGPVPAPVKYWDVPFRRLSPMTEQEAGEELIQRLRDSVRIRLISEVPLGAFLSGGVDSSGVVAMMAGLVNDPVVTCSIAFGDKQFNEAAYAEKVAQQFKTQHHVEQVDADDVALVDRLANVYDEPYADSSAIPTYRVCELARKRVTVALSGDGGDESFGGYRRYRWHMHEERLRSRIPLQLRRPVFGLLGQFYPKADWAPRVFRAKSTFEALSRDSVEAYFHSVSVLHDGMRSQLFSPRFRTELQGYKAVDVLRRHAACAPSDHPLSLIQYLDFKTYLVGDINTKVDRASMAHALEVREPLMDHLLVEWLSGLPPALKLRKGEGKYVLKKALEPYLPADILYRSKMGFAVPLAKWFRGPLRRAVSEAVLGPVLGETGWFNRAYLQRLLQDHQSGRRDYSPSLWTIMMFESFLRNVCGGTAKAAPSASNQKSSLVKA
jgi:asparagine synthase (glutamine-hydrolysing)